MGIQLNTLEFKWARPWLVCMQRAGLVLFNFILLLIKHQVARPCMLLIKYFGLVWFLYANF